MGLFGKKKKGMSVALVKIRVKRCDFDAIHLDFSQGASNVLVPSFLKSPSSVALHR